MISPTELKRPKVLIVGAGVGGITLAILLETAGVPYDVYERAAEVKPLGAALYLGPNVAPLFRQIGIYDEFVAHSKPCKSITVFTEHREPSFSIDFGPVKEICVCLAAQTAQFDIESFPELKDEKCHFNNVLAENRPYSWMTWTTKNNTLCYTVVLYLDKESSKENDSFRNSEWGAEAAEAMCSDVRDFPIPGGDSKLTLGDLIDNTPKNQISKVMLEEKVFDTWYGARTVLIGDGKRTAACMRQLDDFF
ncbi:hypothetical protein BGZ75_005711 [Mortierella antarctica]|nr:hypothetical protein BGZ75_005711 [Mortierella antarctica]